MSLDAEIISYPSRTFYYNEKTGRLEGMVDGLQAVIQTADTILNIERWQYQIVSSVVGIEADNLISESYNLVCCELKRTIEEALSIDDRITGVDSFTFEESEDEDDALLVKFTMHTVYGSAPMKKGFSTDA